MKKVLYINSPWMKDYRGAKPGVDMPIGGFGYTKAHPLNDHTQFNFLPISGRYYGHVPGSTNPNLKKLGGDNKTEFVENVLVIWFAIDPDTDERIVVGWYGNAKVWGKRQKPLIPENIKRRTTPDGDISTYTVEAAASSSCLLPPGRRPKLLVGVTSRRGRPGQNPFWYGNSGVNAYIQKIIHNPKLRALPQKSINRAAYGGRLLDTEERLKIEQCAMDHVMQIYQQDEYVVKDVHADKLGYDIHAESNRGILYLEVKGKKGEDVSIELTPNEYRFAKLHRKNFRVCVVLDALKEKRKLVELQFFRGDRWLDREGGVYSGKELPSLLIGRA